MLDALNKDRWEQEGRRGGFKYTRRGWSHWTQVRHMKVIRSAGGRRRKSREKQYTLERFSHLEGDATV